MKTPLEDLEQQLRTHYQQEFGEPSPLPHLLAKLDGRLPAQQEPLIWRQRLLQALPFSRISAPSVPRLAWSQQREPRRFMALAAVLIVVLVGAMVLTFSSILRSGETFRLVLVPTEQASPVQMAMTRTILLERFSGFGLQGVSVQLTTAHGHPEILVDLPHFGGDETVVINTLVERGVLEFWDTGPFELKVGAKLDPGQYRHYNPAGKPRFTGQDLDPNQIAEGSYSQGRFEVSFAMKSSSSEQFYTFTQKSIGSYLTITLDKNVLVSAMIQAGINGMGSINVGFTQQQTQALATALKYGSLPVTLQQQR